MWMDTEAYHLRAARLDPKYPQKYQLSVGRDLRSTSSNNEVEYVLRFFVKVAKSIDGKYQKGECANLSSCCAFSLRKTLIL